MLDLADSLECDISMMVEQLFDRAGGMRAKAIELTETAKDNQKEAPETSRIAAEARADVQTVAAAARELSASIAEIGGRVERSTRLSDRAKEETRAAERSMGALRSSASDIGVVVDLINSIASRTNLLAHNATIEVARAGEAGGGSPRSRTRSSFSPIRRRTQPNRSAFRSKPFGIRRRRRTRVVETIGSVSEISASIAFAVEQQNAATCETARGVERLASGADALCGRMETVSDEAAITEGSSTDVLTDSSEIVNDVNSIFGDVKKIVNDIRAH